MRRQIVGSLVAIVTAFVAVGVKGQPSPALPDLVVGYIEANSRHIVIHYQNQGPGVCRQKYISLKISGEGQREQHEIFTLDHQPAPQQPYEIQHSQPIPWEKLGPEAAKSRFAALVIAIDPRDEVPETNEVNNVYQEQVNGQVDPPELPDFRRYPGLPDIAIQDITFEAPHTVVATIVNRGKGMTMGTFKSRLTIKGVKNDLARTASQHQPLPGSRETRRAYFDFRNWGYKLGDTVSARVEIDPDRSLPDADRSNNEKTVTLTLGGSVKTPEALEQKVSGRVSRSGVSVDVKSAFALWKPLQRQLCISFFPFSLGPKDLQQLAYGDERAVVSQRVEKGEFKRGNLTWAQLVLTFEPGTRRLDLKHLEGAQWSVRTDLGGTTAQSGQEPGSFTFDPVDLKDGTSFGFRIDDRYHELLAQTQGRLRIVAQPGGEPQEVGEHHIPQELTPSVVRGRARFRGKTMNGVSAVVTYSDQSPDVKLFIVPKPIRPEHTYGLGEDDWTVVVADLKVDELAILQAYFSKKNRWKDPKVELCSKNRGLVTNWLRRSEDEASNYVAELIDPQFKPGGTVKFRIRSLRAGLDLDFEGTATLVKRR